MVVQRERLVPTDGDGWKAADGRSPRRILSQPFLKLLKRFRNLFKTISKGQYLLYKHLALMRQQEGGSLSQTLNQKSNHSTLKLAN